MEQTSHWRITAPILSLLAIVLLLVAWMGLAFIGYQYSSDVIARIRFASVVALLAIVGLNWTVFGGAKARSKSVAPAVWVLLIGVCLYIAGCTPTS